MKEFSAMNRLDLSTTADQSSGRSQFTIFNISLEKVQRDCISSKFNILCNVHLLLLPRVRRNRSKKKGKKERRRHWAHRQCVRRVFLKDSKVESIFVRNGMNAIVTGETRHRALRPFSSLRNAHAFIRVACSHCASAYVDFSIWKIIYRPSIRCPTGQFNQFFRAFFGILCAHTITI